jgi:hypothetical protein
MKAMNFYTASGWAGSNYDSKLSTKEIAAKVRAFAKKNFPEFKFSVRSEWSMYTDSMYVELKEGTCIPFVEGSRSAERGYMSTMNTVKGWEDELTPEMFKVLNAVTTYASSFRYDDSDGMQDYFDTNFYLKIKVSDEYKVVEPKAKKSSVKAEKVEEAKEVEAVTVEGLEIVDYSEKAVAVFGDTKAIKEHLKELGGRFNPSLNYNGEKRAGWIFSKKQADKVKGLVEAIKLSEPVSNTNISQKKRGKSLQDIIDQTRRLNSYAGRNWYWSFKREKLINKIYSDYITNIQKLGAFSYPEKKFTKEEYTGITPTEIPGIVEVGQKEVAIKEGDLIAFKTNSFQDSEVYKGSVEYKEQLGFVVFVDGVQYELRKAIDIRRLQDKTEHQENETYPLENISFTETDNLNGVCYYDIEGAGAITSAKVRADIQPGDVFNVYTAKERKYGVTYDGVSLESSLNKDLPGIIETNNKIEAGTLSASSFYKPILENVEFYEKKANDKRYITRNNPKGGYYHVIDTLDNCPVGFFRTKEEAEKEVEILNGATDGNGRLKSVV